MLKMIKFTFTTIKKFVIFCYYLLQTVTNKKVLNYTFKNYNKI